MLLSDSCFIFPPSNIVNINRVLVLCEHELAFAKKKSFSLSGRCCTGAALSTSLTHLTARTINTRYSANAKNARFARPTASLPPSVDCNFAPRRLNLDWNKLAEISLRRMRNEVKERRPPIERVYGWLQHSTIHYLSLLWRPGRFLRPETGLRIVRVGCT